MPPKIGRKRPAAALSTVPGPLSKSTVQELTVPVEKKPPWNKGTKLGKSDLQHLFIPRDDYALFLAVAIWFAGPKYAMAMWLTMATSRRISETLRLHGEDAYLKGGQYHDSPHVLFQKRAEEKKYRGAGKLGGDHVVARLSPDACTTLEQVMERTIERKLLPPLEPFQTSHPEVFNDTYPMTTEAFKWPNDGKYVFPAATRKSKKPWMARQSVSLALARTLDVMYRLTQKRRWNNKFKGSHVTVHGATRHTAAALLLSKPKEGSAVPTEHVILEIQQRHDIRTFRRHYCHAQEDEVSAALAHASVPILFHEDMAAPEPASPSTTVANPLPEASSSALAAKPVASSGAPAAKPVGNSSAPAAKSRNAWRQKKRREGKQAWKASQNSEAQGQF